MTKTTLIPNAIQMPAGKIKSERVIPYLSASKPTGFVGIKSGKAHPHGVLVELEQPLSADDLLKAYLEKNKLTGDKKHAHAVLEKFIKDLQTFKPGNVLFIHYSKTGEFTMNVIAESAPPEQNRF